MNAAEARMKLRDQCRESGVELHSQAPNQLHFLLRPSDDLFGLCHRLRDGNCYLVTAFANDERELEDHCFKIYYVFSHPREDIFLILENILEAEFYPSISPIFTAMKPFEREIADLFGLYPREHGETVKHHAYLHTCYPPDFYPLRRDRSLKEIQIALESYTPTEVEEISLEAPPRGQVYLPVGPIHAGVIESGRFLFCIGSETIESLDIRLGFTHKGIEYLFQSQYDLQNGWQLAEEVSGDSVFAHSLAYCQAVESLARVEPPSEAILLRGLFLELERMANHIGDCGALAQDVALDVVASEMAVLREEILRLNERLAGHRFLRGLNRPGGSMLPHALDTADALQAVTTIVARFLELAQILVEMNDFRERTIGIGLLGKEQAERLGVVGMTARASGLQRDYRLQHPFGTYKTGKISQMLREGQGGFGLPDVFQRSMRGDIFSRFLVRAQEVSLSLHLVQAWLGDWEATTQTDFTVPIDLATAPNFEFGLGYVEAWRGDIVYWIMKDKYSRIYRCKVRDPSTLNWPGLKISVEPCQVNGYWMETSLVDFPVVNKSFNLSYSGSDL